MEWCDLQQESLFTSVNTIYVFTGVAITHLLVEFHLLLPTEFILGIETSIVFYIFVTSEEYQTAISKNILSFR